MPFLLPHHDDQHQLLYIGKCRYATFRGQSRYVVISLRGCFTLNEAVPFLIQCMAIPPDDQGELPFYGDYFTHNVYVSSMFMNVVVPIAKKHKKIRYYIENYGVPRLMSQYEWNIARHDVDHFVAPEERTKKVFGDYLTPAEQYHALRVRDIMQVIKAGRNVPS